MLATSELDMKQKLIWALVLIGIVLWISHNIDESRRFHARLDNDPCLKAMSKECVDDLEAWKSDQTNNGMFHD